MDKINEIIEKMTLEEKAALCTGATAWTTTPLAHLGVPELVVSDGPHGVRHPADPASLLAEAIPSTCFPTASCMASTWNVDLVHALGQAIAEECIAQNVNVILGPGTNMKRTPLGGRNFEYYSEDPYLAGRMSVSFINGVQSQGVGTSLKHYAVNNQETHRLGIDARLDERTLREIYLPAFEMAVKEARPWSVMCSYNKLNGEYAAECRRLLTGILKEEWGFEGFVVSDWGAVNDRVASMKAGLDLEMPGPRERRVHAVIDAVRSGELDGSILDESVRRILRILFIADRTPRGEPFNVDAHHALARRAAAEGMVLLKNNGILPLKDQKRIAVIGRAAAHPHFQGGGSSHINPTRVDNPLDELKKTAPGVEFTWSEGYPDGGGFDQAMIDAAVDLARNAQAALLFLALPSSKESEGYDRPDLDLTPQHIALIKAVAAAQPETVVVLNNGAPVVMSEWVDSPAAILEAWMMGQAGAGAIADILFGVINPSGRLAETFPLKLTDTPAYLNFPGENGQVRYGEGIFIGYRYYDMKEMPVLFPFGHGLSYTTFAFSNPRVSASTFKDVDGLIVSVDVTNTGSLAGSEVVQVYVHDHKSALARPPRELKGFAKVELQPGETRTVSLPLDLRAFAFFHPAYDRWVTEDGEFDILFGASASEIRCSQTVTLQSTMELPCILTRESTLGEWMADPRGREVCAPIFDQIIAPMRSIFADGEDAGMDPLGFFMDMPLEGMLYFLGGAMFPAPEDTVKEMLDRAHGQDEKQAVL